MTRQDKIRAWDPLPAWVPQGVRHYLEHTEAGQPIRQLARSADVHASTVLRQIRRYETRRDDPLVDDALRSLSDQIAIVPSSLGKDTGHMSSGTSHFASSRAEDEDRQLRQESMRILRRMAESGAVMAVARDMEKGVVVREDADGTPQRLAIVDREVAQTMALQDWIACSDLEARISRYRITGAGRSALKDFMAAEENLAQGFAEAQRGFDHRSAAAEPMRQRLGLIDSPLTGLARRKDRDGMPFLPRDLVVAGERLREDYELSQMEDDAKLDWEKFLVNHEAMSKSKQIAGNAKSRVAAALEDLGPGHSDVALRACCYLEGMESLEKRMGWSARSGKIVLRIALQRLQRHYLEINGGLGPKIG